MKKRKIILAAASCLAIISASFGITYAYLISDKTVVNEFTVGENTIEIEEKFDPPPEIKFNEPFTKEVRIKNTGNIECYVRARVEFSDSFAEEYSELDYRTKPDDPWIYNAIDGYYYYKELLPPYQKLSDKETAGITDCLFSQVTIKNKAGGETITEDNLVNFDIMVYAESCEKGSAEDYKEAWTRSCEAVFN